MYVRSPLSARLWAWLPFVASAALVALAIDLALRSPLLGGLLGTLALLVFLPQLVSRRRVRRILVSGDINAVLEVWNRSLDQLPHRETLGPLLLATALAAHGLTDRARRVLERAQRGDAWEAAIEHRLFVEALLDAFEGQRVEALHKAESLEKLPLPAAGPFLRERMVLLRSALAAFTRAFARNARPGDVELLERAAKTSPLVHWAMRYAAAVAMVDGGRRGDARRMLDSAPPWPEESAFHFFHRELEAELKLA
ncbi:MAG TPA: hypothetical protein VM686_33525 [Polyangiaceae bacterium]|jgi:hypothetical protein|nr:hypothetical protein [Polyangiaceae bacterium]